MYNYCENGWPDGIDIDGRFSRFSGIVVYPNPVEDVINIVSNLDIRVNLYDMSGKILKQNITEKQRYNDHDKANARYHVNEIDTRLSFDNLTASNYVKDNNLEIDYGGAITLRQNGSVDSFLMSDGLTRPGKLFKIGICLNLVIIVI